MLSPKKVVDAVNQLNDIEGVPQGKINKKISWGALFIYVLIAATALFIWLFINARNDTVSKDQYNISMKERDYYRNRYDSIIQDNYLKTYNYAKSLEEKMHIVDSLNDVLELLEYKQQLNANLYNSTVKTLSNAAKK